MKYRWLLFFLAATVIYLFQAVEKISRKILVILVIEDIGDNGQRKKRKKKNYERNLVNTFTNTSESITFCEYL